MTITKLYGKSTELQSHYYVHIWTNTLEKGMNLILPSYELNSVTAVFLQGWPWH